MICPKRNNRFTKRFARLLSLLLCLSFLTLFSTPAQAHAPVVALPSGFIQESVVTGLSLPTSFAIAPDGRIFIAQKDGIVRVVQDGELLPTPFIDLRHEVNVSADRGLMGVAVHPNFPSTPYLYLSYVYEPVEASGISDEGARVSRVLRISADSANPNVYVPGSGVVIAGANSTFANIGNPQQGNQPPFSCQSGDGFYVPDCLPAEGTAHIIGMVRFGPDGALYVANGDGTQNFSANGRAVDPNSLAGKILRVDPISGLGYANNPFYDGDPTSNRSKVFAMGMRNPFRFTFSPTSGELFVADVGNDVWEEINRGGPGANFGWPCFEGPDRAADHAICQPLFDGAAPVTTAAYTYDHSEGRGAAIGGDFYTGNTFPSEYRGVYFYGDFNIGTIQALSFSGGAQVQDFATNAGGVVQINAVGNDLYVLYIGQGKLSRIRYAGENVPPVALFNATPLAGRPPLTVTFDARPSYDANGDEFQVAWDFGSGDSYTNTTDLQTTHVYSEAGQFVTTLRLTDSRGAVSSATAKIYVGNEPPKAEILLPKPDATYRIGDEIQFLGWAEDSDDGLLTGDNLAWTATLHHRDHEHYDFHNSQGTSGVFTFADHGDNAYLTLCLTATDLEGLQAKKCVDLEAEEVVYTFKSKPSGMPILYAGSTYTTPFKVLTYANAVRPISTALNPAPDMKFLIWSDGGPRRRDITVQAGDRTLTAIFGGPQAGNRSEANAEIEDADIAFVNQGAFTPAVVSSSASASRAVAPAASSTVSTPGISSVSPATDENVTNRGGGEGRILREWWLNVEGATVPDLRKHPDFPLRPAGSDFITAFEVPTSFGDNFGQRTHGYLYPPVSGDYQFWIAADDAGELWLSTDDKPANARWIAGTTTWTNQREWARHPEQTSAVISLKAGQRYYIMALQKEANNKDNLAVAWLIPGGEQSVIDGAYLSPFEGGGE